jgi:hypothetical protein
VFETILESALIFSVIALTMETPPRCDVSYYWALYQKKISGKKYKNYKLPIDNFRISSIMHLQILQDVLKGRSRGAKKQLHNLNGRLSPRSKDDSGDFLSRQGGCGEHENQSIFLLPHIIFH